MPNRREAAIDFLSFISNNNPKVNHSSTKNDENSFYISPSSSPLHDSAPMPLQDPSTIITPVNEANGTSQSHESPLAGSKSSSRSLLHLRLQQQMESVLGKKENHLNSTREEAALEFLGRISSFSDLLGYTIPDTKDTMLINSEGNHILSAHVMQSSNNGGHLGSGIDLMDNVQASKTIPLPIPSASTSNYMSNYMRNALNNSSISSAHSIPAAIPSRTPDDDPALCTMGISGSNVTDTPASYIENSTTSNQLLRNSLYKSPGIPRKSLNRLYNISAHSSELSIIDPLYVFTFAGGPISLFSMMPLVKHEQKKSRNTSGAGITSISGARAAGKRPIGAILQSNASPYYNTFSPYLEKMGLTTISFDVKLQRKRVAESFACLLDPQGLLEPNPIPELSTYDPYYLDHPDLRSGKNKTVITLPCFLGTIMQPSTARDIKKELNQHFKEAHPGLYSTITLSQIRSIKLSLCKVGVARDLEPSSVAFAHVYLEKLILRNFLNKSNKKLIASCCLLLAVKVNDSKDINYSALVELLEKEMEVPRKDIYASEFHVYTELEFGLFLPFWEVGPHLNRAGSMMDELRHSM